MATNPQHFGQLPAAGSRGVGVRRALFATALRLTKCMQLTGWMLGCLVGMAFGCRGEKPAANNEPPPAGRQPTGERTATGYLNLGELPGRVTNSIGMPLVLVSAGEFMMGSRESDPDAREDETPRRRVRIRKPFYIGMHEVTQGNFEQVFGERRSFFRPNGPGKSLVEGMDTTGFPAEQVRWVDAVEFCLRLSALPNERDAGRVYRLPTEAEWEYACRAGTDTSFHYGDSLDALQANFRGTYPFGDAEPGPFRNRTTAAGSFEPNAIGLHDMHGNVWEWCSDWYGREYYQASTVDDPQGPPHGSRKVIRGGDWYSDGCDCRSAFRNADLPRGTFYATGMRVVMTLRDGSGVASPAEPLSAELATREVKVELATSADPTLPDADGEAWPRWRGPRGNGTWQGPRLPTTWPAGGLRRVWRHPLGGGYGGLAVADGRVYVMDRRVDNKEMERVLCFRAATGELVWEHEYAVDYTDVAYGNGPRTTPTILDGHVYALGGTGHLCCLNVDNGDLIWSIDLVADYRARVPLWGFSASPLVFEDLLIVHAGAQPDGCLIAYDRATGSEVWHSLPDGAGYATPIVVDNGGQPQLVIWTPSTVSGVDPRGGELLWSVPFVVNNGTSIATPIFEEGMVLVSGYYDGAKAIRLGDQPSDVEVVWEDRRTLRAEMAQPLYRDGHAYLLDRRHGLTCFELATGRKLWDDENRMTPKGRNPQATMVWLGDEDRAVILNSDGELILARLNPEGYHEESRTKIIGETWAHPAYAGNHVYARSDSELVCVSLLDGPSIPDAAAPQP